MTMSYYTECKKYEDILHEWKCYIVVTPILILF